MSIVRCVLFAFVLASGCGDDDDCPSGLERIEGRCVEVGGDGGVDAGDDGGGGVCGGRGTLQVYTDADGDGWGASGSAQAACDVLDGQADRGGDCDDDDALVHPEADEECNGRDDDCSGGPDDGFDCVASSTSPCLTECGSTGQQRCSEACVPSSCEIVEETCNHVDDDCDGLVDEDLQGWLDDPVQVTNDANVRRHVPVVGWTGTDIVVGWGATEIDGKQRKTIQVGTFALDGAPALAPLEIAQPDPAAEATALGVLGELALFGYANEPEDGVAEPTVLIAPLVEGAGVVPLPLEPAGDVTSFSCFEVLPVGAGGMIVSLLAPFEPPNEVRVEAWSLDPIMPTESLTFANLVFADVTLTPAGELLVAWSATGEVLVGRYDGALGELDAPRIVTATGGQVVIAHVVSVGDGSLLVYGTIDHMLHALALTADLDPGDPVDIGIGIPFPDMVVSSGSDVLVLAVDFDADVTHFVRLGATGEPSDGPTDFAGYPDRVLIKAAWAGDRWATVWVAAAVDAQNDVYLQSYGCVPGA